MAHVKRLLEAKFKRELQRLKKKASPITELDQETRDRQRMLRLIIAA